MGSFSENLTDCSILKENEVEVLTISSDFDEFQSETLTSSDWEPHVSEINIEKEREIQFMNQFKEKSSEEEFSEEIDQIDLKMKNISVNNVSHKDFNYAFKVDDFSKILDKEPSHSEIKNNQEINIEDIEYFKKKFPIIFDLEEYKKEIENEASPIQFNKSIKCEKDENLFILSIYIDDQAYDASKKKSVKAIYLVVENFETGSRLKDKTIFLLMNLPKNAPIYNLTVPLPFIKEIYKLSKMKYLYKHKIKVIFHQIIGDSVEQQKAAGKLSSGGIEMCRSYSLNKKDIFFNLGKSLHLEDTTSKLNSNSKQEDSNPNPNINSDSNKPFNFNSNPDQNLNPEIENLNSNFFDFEVKTNLRDPKQIKQIQKECILNFFRSKDYQQSLKEFGKIKTNTGVLYQTCNFWLHFFGFNSCDFSRFSICWAHLLLEGLFKDGLRSIKLRLNDTITEVTKQLNYLNSYFKFINLPSNPLNKPKDLTAIECLELSMILGLCIKKSKENEIIFHWLDLFNRIISNLYLPSRNEETELELEYCCDKFRIKHIELVDYFIFKTPHKKNEEKNSLIKINEIRKIKIKNILLKKIILQDEMNNKEKKTKQKNKRLRRINKKLIVYKNKKSGKTKINTNSVSTYESDLKNNIQFLQKSIQHKNKDKLNNLLKQPNIHYLRHLPQSVRENGSLFTFFLALERYHQHNKIKKYQIKKKGFSLLKFFIEREIFRKINENSKKNFDLEKKNIYNLKISKELYIILNFFNYDLSDLVGLKEIYINSHIFKVGNFVCTFDETFYYIREIFQDSSKKKYLLVQKIKADPNEIKFTFDNPRKFYLISPDEFRNIINLIPNTWNKYLISKSESEKEIVLKGTDQMEIEKDQEQGTTQINQIEQVSGEITIEKEDTNETIGSNNIIGVDDQKDPKKFEILVKYNLKLLPL
ncbi:hypothetical protein M0813_01584 [Anaeramoeba flamelloides]|uniref:Uncharacterized protein n=1 Tax=Anaeramoeba flamelloides TaxID=1746091 RepID=A0ABQ8Z4U0_9EUKA|nr:hypothetical protein M0813_01584 [Anaeramoeba flamelloides]